MEKIVLGRFDENDPLQHMMKCMFGCGIFAGFRGCTEHTYFTREQVVFGTYGKTHEPRELAGLPYVAITHLQDKTKKLSIHNSYLRDTGHHLRFPIVSSDPNNFGGALQRLVAKMSPGQVRIYCQPGSPSYLKTLEMNGYGHACFMFNKPLGPKSVAALFKKGAKLLGLPENFRPHSLRAAFITKMANDPSVSMSETMLASRHNSVAASANYQRSDGLSELNRLRAIGVTIPPNNSKKAKVCAGDVSLSPTTPTIERCHSPIPFSPAVVTPPKAASIGGGVHMADTIGGEDDDDFVQLSTQFDTLSLSEWSCMNEDLGIANAQELAWTQTWENLGEEEEGGKGEVESIVLKGRKGEGKKEAEAVSMTQVGIEGLEYEILELEDAIEENPKKKQKREPSMNQKMIVKLSEQVRKLKIKVDERENEGLYRDSIAAMEENDREDELKMQLRRERQRNERLEAENEDYERILGRSKRRYEKRKY